MTKKLTVTFVAAFVMLTVIVAVLSAPKGDQRRPPPGATHTNKTLILDTSPAQFPQR